MTKRTKDGEIECSLSSKEEMAEQVPTCSV